MLSVVIPTLNAASGLAGTLASLPGALVGELIVSDGGSVDDTIRIAHDNGARVVRGPAGRGAQLARGAEAAVGDWILFLHADTRLGPGAGDAITDFMAAPDMAAPDIAPRAGYFRFRLDDAAFRARLIEWGVALRCRMFALPYGDQGLLMSRAAYRELGGFKQLPLMEDVDMVRRIGRRGLVALLAEARTSATRYRREGYARRVTRNLSCLALYFMGLPPERIAQLYERP